MHSQCILKLHVGHRTPTQLLRKGWSTLVKELEVGLESEVEGIFHSSAIVRTECFLFLLIPSLEIKCELVDQNRKCKQKNQPITWLIPNRFTQDLEKKTWQLSVILNESKASISASVLLIRTRSEGSSDSDSDSDSDSASATAVNHV